MDKIAYIVPSETMIPMAEQSLKREIEEGAVRVLTTDVFHPFSEYRRLCNEGYGCIIARGGTYRDLKKVADTVPVMEEKIRTSDVLYMLNRVREKHSCKIYVILHDRTVLNFEETVSLFAFPLEVKRYDSPLTLKRVIEEIPESDVVILSSGIASKVSKRTDVTFVELMNKENTMRETVRVARDFLVQFQENIKKVNVMESILNNVDEGIVIFDNAFITREMNAKAEKYLQILADDLVGQDIHRGIPDLPEKRTDGSCNAQSPKTFMRKIGQTMLSFNIHPFEFFKGEQRYIMTMQDVTKIQELEKSIRMNLSKKGLVAEYHFDDILTQNGNMKKLIERGRTIARYEGSVLLCGENGTGKELFAQSIHNASRRRNGPFVAVNCAALAESLLESELFGYVGGAFTGARKEGKAGLFELAHQGTIFLDEINSMPFSLQSKILRVIEQQEVMRVGSDYVIPLDVRIIAASNANLKENIMQDSFRKDLYFRLNTFQLSIPPLRERKEDILLLFRHYLSELEGRDADDIRIEPDFERQLMTHTWSGNVREIRSTALRFHAFKGDNSTGNIIDIEESCGALIRNDLKIDLRQLNRTVEQLVIESLLDKDLSKSEIAEILGISRQALYKKIGKTE